jgi:hypothetical protein
VYYQVDAIQAGRETPFNARVFATHAEEQDPLDSTYSEESQEIARFLVRMERPAGRHGRELSKWKRNALRYFVEGRMLFRRSSKATPSRRVLDSRDLQVTALSEIHRQLGHRGRESTYFAVSQRYYWARMYDDVKKFVATCNECQYASTRRNVEEMRVSWTNTLWEWVSIDVVHMPREKGKEYLVLAREGLSGWVEGRALSKNNAASIAKFIFEDLIARWGCMQRLTTDGGPEFRADVIRLLQQYGVHRVQASTHHPESMGFIERGHQPVKNALAKLPGNWVDNLSAVLLADRITVKRTTGMTPYRLVTGQNPILPIDMVLPSWRVLPWANVSTTEELLALRAQQLDIRNVEVEEAAARTRRIRDENKDSWDDRRNIRAEGEIQAEDLVLLWDSVLATNMSKSRKLTKKWMGPYRVRHAYADRNYYQLEELDGTAFRHTTAGSKIKKFLQRSIDTVAAEQEGRRQLFQSTAQDQPDEDSAHRRSPEIRIPTMHLDPDEYAVLDSPSTSSDMDEPGSP